MNAKTLASILLCPALLTLPACDLGSGFEPNDDASRSEMREAVVEVAELGDGLGAQDDVIELTTSFTLGQGAQAAAEEIRDFVRSQVPCSTVTLEPGLVSIDFGDLSDSCTYRGRTYAGVITVQVELPGQGAEAARLRLFLLGQLLLQFADAQLLALLPEVGEAHGIHVHLYGIREVRQGVAAGEQEGVGFVLI